MTATDPHDLIALYDRGVLTSAELVSRLVALGENCPPDEIAAVIPKEFVDRLRVLSQTIPRAEDVMTLEGVTAIPGSGIERERYHENEVRSYVTGLTRWHDYFLGADRAVAPSGLG